MEIDEDVVSPEQDQQQITPKKSEEKLSFFQRLIAFFLGRSDPEFERKRLLKEVVKALKKQRLKFYRARHEIMDPMLAKYFFEFYKTLGPAQSLIKYADYSGVLKSIVIENTLTPEYLDIKERLGEESIRKRAKIMDAKSLTKEIKNDLITFFAAFDIDKAREINHIYHTLSVFVDLTHFDYYFLLKKFDSGLPEGNFFYTPRFEPINGEYIVEDLKEFSYIIEEVNENADWDRVLDLLKEYRGVDIVPRAAWKKTVARIKELRRSRVLLLIIQHIDKNPYFKIKQNLKTKKIVEPYLSKLKTQTELSLQKIFKERHSSKLDEFTKLVFGTASISRLKNYTEKANIAFSKKMLAGFIYVQPLNYLKAFLLDFLKKDIKGVVDLLIIKGKWATNLTSQELSESFHRLLEISDNITEFDDSVAEESNTGTKLKTYFHKSDKEKAAQKVLRQMLKEINDMAKGMIHEAAQNLVTLGKNIKMALDDYTRQPHELIINWKEIEVNYDSDLKSTLVNIYKKIYYIVKLLQIFFKEE
ncbi:MAG: hypothetical protein JW822_03510 [Spirochaetales bacterium]|nr:hypothetical protein [Spirochaetales bacterium]